MAKHEATVIALFKRYRVPYLRAKSIEIKQNPNVKPRYRMHAEKRAMGANYKPPRIDKRPGK